MKKLLSLFSILSITGSTFTVASCSMVNYKVQSIKNKVNNLVQVSSTLLRGSIIQNASQNSNSGLAYDSNYLNSLILNSKSNNLIPNFKTDAQTTMKNLNETYFGSQDLNRDSINNLNKDFLTNNVKSPTSSLDSFSSNFILFSSVLKTNGGIHPSISGLIQGLLPTLNLKNTLAETLNSESLKSIANLIQKTNEPLSETLGFLQQSNIFYAVLKNFFNSDFENSRKENDTENIEKWVKQFISEVKLNGLDTLLEELVNKILTQDKSEDVLTGQMIINSSLNRFHNILARVTKQENKVINSSKLYDTLSKNFDKDLGDLMGDFLKGLNLNLKAFDFKALLLSIIKSPENISDILFIISGLLKYVSSLDFSDFIPENDDKLFDYTKSNDNFLKELNNKTLKDNSFKIKMLFKNLSLITNVKTNANGKQLQKLFYMLFNSGKKVTEIDENINLLTLINKLSSPIFGSNSKNNYSSLLYGIGKGIAIWQGWSFVGLGADQVGNLIRWVIGDGLGYNSDFSGLNNVLNILKSLGIEINLKVSEKTTLQLKHLFNAIYDEDSTIFKDLIGKQMSLYSIFNQNIVLSMKISDIIDLIYKNIASNGNEQKINTDKLKNGLNILSNELVKDNYTLWYKNSNNFVQYKESSINKQGNYNALQAMIISSSKNGMYLKLDNSTPINENIKGTKAAMYALGTDYDEKGNQKPLFRDKSLLLGLENIFDDQVTIGILDDLTRGFQEIIKINNNISNSIYKKLIENANFETKIISSSNIDTDKEQSITYKTVYTNPFNETKTSYEINLILKINQDSWQINSIRRL
ncbi:hypothetical protein [Spiroplasma floricola]|uniref:MOLPALP family lipoprotein n=1 Tax=Spiroplasma floricola 23-6 TaxID=1336749 RepID=A0A2K8SD99_9MOLU|nr:hypothetical protein [Spiroplasma floricola]AUB31444.1 hypothetical protein SFLOR_v1c03890 [Spiroplasma floricola 23-6]